jgi:hypothetical protein
LRHIKQRGHNHVQNNSRRNISDSNTGFGRISRLDEANDEENGSFDVNEERSWHEENDEEE